MEENNRREKDAIDNLKPKAAFKAGLFTGLGVMFAIGFFILLGMMLNDKDFSLDKGNGNTNDNDVVVNNGDNNPPPAGNTEIIVNGLSDGDWVRGDKNAEITIVEFSDVDCPFCTRFHNTTKQVLAEYEGRVNFVFRHFRRHWLLWITRKRMIFCSEELASIWHLPNIRFNKYPSKLKTRICKFEDTTNLLKTNSCPENIRYPKIKNNIPEIKVLV